MVCGHCDDVSGGAGNGVEDKRSPDEFNHDASPCDKSGSLMPSLSPCVARELSELTMIASIDRTDEVVAVNVEEERFRADAVFQFTGVTIAETLDR